MTEIFRDYILMTNILHGPLETFQDHSQGNIPKETMEKKRKKEITFKNNSQRNICKASGTRSLIQATQKQLWLKNNGPESRLLPSAGFLAIIRSIWFLK